MKYQNLKNMTVEEKEIHKRKQKAKAQRKYYQTHKDYYKNYSTKWARQEKINLKNEIDRLNNVINELEKWLKGLIENFDEDVSEPILHEQMTINLVYEYLDKLKELKENE